MFRAPTGVVRDLIIINILMFIGTLIVMGEPVWGQLADGSVGFTKLGRMNFASFLPGTEHFRPYQIFTHMFMHADIGHLFFNMLMLYFLGPQLEMMWGNKKFLTFYLLTGLGAWLLHTAITYAQVGGTLGGINYHMLGASGAVYGIMAGYGITFAEQKIQLLIPPIPIKAKYLVLGLGVLALHSSSAGIQTNVAHFAHIGGAAIGMVLVGYWDVLRLPK